MNYHKFFTEFGINDFFDEASRYQIRDNAHIEGNKIEVEMPGVTRESIEIIFEPHELKLSWTNRAGQKMSGLFWLKTSVVDAESKLENGVLYITLKESPDSHKKIAVK